MQAWIFSLLFGLAVFVIVYVVGKIWFDLPIGLDKRMRSIEEIGSITKGTGANGRKRSNRKKNQNLKVSERFAHSLEAAGIDIEPENYLVIWGLSATIPGIVGFLALGNPVVGALLFVAGVIAPIIYVRIRRARRVSMFSAQLGDALMIISNCLRSGLSFRQAMERVASDMPDPLKTVFQNGANKLNYGAALEDVLSDIARDMESGDMELLNAAVTLNQRVGGGLAEIVDTASGTIRERIQMRQRLRALSSMGRMSGWVLGLMPVVLLIFFSVTNPTYVEWFFKTTSGNIVLGVAAGWEIIGIVVIQKIVNIKL